MSISRDLPRLDLLNRTFRRRSRPWWLAHRAEHLLFPVRHGLTNMPTVTEVREILMTAIEEESAR